jgi:NDP-4-keto-2,6-dideoxyhexose 3-C-methyltransferase
MKEPYQEITACRVCGNTDLDMILDLGNQSLTGVFPSSADESVTSGPLQLVKCVTRTANEACGLVQLRQTYSIAEMYGDNYGYRSGLNLAMVDHLKAIVGGILDRIDIEPGDLIIDIGSNDGTLLGFYPSDSATLVGIDPTAQKFRDYYPDHVRVMPQFFSSEAVKTRYGGRKAMAVTSISMFYDLEQPLEFTRNVHEILADDGIWILEQSYLPTMMEMNAYDTVCHEHLEYYALRQIKWMAERVGFKIVDVGLNTVNGGSFAVILAKSTSRHEENKTLVDEMLSREQALGLETLEPYRQFRRRVQDHRDELQSLIRGIRAGGQSIMGLGASTKGNVVLQYCGFTRDDISSIAEVNQDKFGRLTPGTHIPIVSEAEARAFHPDYFMVLPWHFKDHFVSKESRYLESGGKLLFPLPSIEIVSN